MTKYKPTAKDIAHRKEIMKLKSIISEKDELLRQYAIKLDSKDAIIEYYDKMIDGFDALSKYNESQIKSFITAYAFANCKSVPGELFKFQTLLLDVLRRKKDER